MKTEKWASDPEDKQQKLSSLKNIKKLDTEKKKKDKLQGFVGQQMNQDLYHQPKTYPYVQWETSKRDSVW